MAKLGSFGAAVRELDPTGPRDTFDFFGREFIVHGVIPPMLMLHLGASMTGKIGVVEGNAAIWEALRCALTKPADPDKDEGPDGTQFQQFYKIAVARSCAIDDLIQLVFALVGAQDDLPTEQLPASQDGQLQTSENSNSSASDTPASPGMVSVAQALGG